MRGRPATIVLSVVMLLTFLRQLELLSAWRGGSWHDIVLFPSDPQVLIRAGAAYGGMNLATESWRLATSAFVHGGLVHLAVNLMALWQLGHLVEVFFGTKVFSASFAIGAIGAALATFAMPAEPGMIYVGASGAIFALAGTLVVGLHREWRRERQRWSRRLSTNVVGCMGVNLLFGLAISAIAAWSGAGFAVANAAHVGGFVTGAALGLLPLHVRRNNQTNRLIRIIETPRRRPAPPPANTIDV